eukprot:4543713-Ditylum_brightwellii.AAC.1
MEVVEQVIKDQYITNDDAVYTLVKSLICCDALQAFQNKDKWCKNKTGKDLVACFAAVTVHAFPSKANKMQK